MILFSLLELVSPLDHNGSTAISLWSDCALPVSGIGSAKLYVVGIYMFHLLPTDM